MPAMDRCIYCCLFSCHCCVLRLSSAYIYCCILLCALCCILIVSHATYEGTPFGYYATDRRQEYGPSLLCTSNGYSYTVLFIVILYCSLHLIFFTYLTGRAVDIARV
jgi:hypothetical protein